ncbi:uncharacterized protein LOC131949973 [Physella acuta]|uniref:uncharacterized protein LOC131949973 n=1 Tax=Physella acuta TaxID=109671 RepID=UPI0027DD7F43|nr:uncharacterized protein LOC131949973 [Physella acuta]
MPLATCQKKRVPFSSYHGRNIKLLQDGGVTGEYRRAHGQFILDDCLVPGQSFSLEFHYKGIIKIGAFPTKEAALSWLESKQPMSRGCIRVRTCQAVRYNVRRPSRAQEIILSSEWSNEPEKLYGSILAFDIEYGNLTVSIFDYNPSGRSCKFDADRHSQHIIVTNALRMSSAVLKHYNPTSLCTPDKSHLTPNHLYKVVARGPPRPTSTGSYVRVCVAKRPENIYINGADDRYCVGTEDCPVFCGRRIMLNPNSEQCLMLKVEANGIVVERNSRCIDRIDVQITEECGLWFELHRGSLHMWRCRAVEIADAVLEDEPPNYPAPPIPRRRQPCMCQRPEVDEPPTYKRHPAFSQPSSCSDEHDVTPYSIQRFDVNMGSLSFDDTNSDEDDTREQTQMKYEFQPATDDNSSDDLYCDGFDYPPGYNSFCQTEISAAYKKKLRHQQTDMNASSSSLSTTSGVREKPEIPPRHTVGMLYTNSQNDGACSATTETQNYNNQAPPPVPERLGKYSVSSKPRVLPRSTNTSSKPSYTATSSPQPPASQPPPPHLSSRPFRNQQPELTRSNLNIREETNSLKSKQELSNSGIAYRTDTEEQLTDEKIVQCYKWLKSIEPFCSDSDEETFIELSPDDGNSVTPLQSEASASRTDIPKREIVNSGYSTEGSSFWLSYDSRHSDAPSMQHQIRVQSPLPAEKKHPSLNSTPDVTSYPASGTSFYSASSRTGTETTMPASMPSSMPSSMISSYTANANRATETEVKFPDYSLGEQTYAKNIDDSSYSTSPFTDMSVDDDSCSKQHSSGGFETSDHGGDAMIVNDLSTLNSDYESFESTSKDGRLNVNELSKTSIDFSMVEMRNKSANWTRNIVDSCTVNERSVSQCTLIAVVDNGPVVNLPMTDAVFFNKTGVFERSDTFKRNMNNVTPPNNRKQLKSPCVP